MSTQPVEHKGYGYTFRQTKKQPEDVGFPLGPETSKKQQADAAEPAATVRERVRALLADVPKSGEGRLSFRDIVNYRDSQEKDWEALATHDLRGLGVDTERSFRLMHDPSTGLVTASNDHPDKARIDQYFASNQEVADEFKSVLQLGKLVDVAERKLTPEQMDQTLDSEAMGWWYQSNMEASALFSGGGIIYGAGSFAYKGIDIRV
ncbi:hypothetical protein [Pseudodesulfovibrio sp. zrk46]|uniref:hypothetical protein n=1 Tax=Pseudodesulfovibrio sp. zrk46 TaxID=2725288 RepID=UPI00144936E8|nr:hypothetical protein [Pseudodesulfovibrio sp. zrk46]QJB55145.1 hypothetical protein HFN16_01440 [Pseudodesulfovibrio sp. zrk46]